MSNDTTQTDYDAECERHAIAQGLGEPAEVLTRNGFTPKYLQTGGWCMVLEAFTSDTVQLWVTLADEGDEDAPLYLVGVYPAEYYDEEPLAERIVPLTELADTVRELSQPANVAAEQLAAIIERHGHDPLPITDLHDECDPNVYIDDAVNMVYGNLIDDDADVWITTCNLVAERYEQNLRDLSR